MSILENVNSSNDIKQLNIGQLEKLAEEIRSFLVNNVSLSGGHLSSNLGTVELTLALHKVFDVYKDRIIWDVGHQSYTHKILTGRKGAFGELRKEGGLSGFPKTQESETDAFNTGHSTTSISAALGYAKAFALSNSSRRAVAVIGDGALTGGMAYEALNHAGSGKEPLIVILNDNGMAISENVGGVSAYLERVCGSARYIELKTKIKRITGSLPIIGKLSYEIIHRSKRILKKLLFKKPLFENLGLEYLGLTNGHDLRDLITMLEYAKGLNKPVIVHVRTQKGKGYSFAEANPTYFHGIQRFDPDTGEVLSHSGPTYSDIFGETAVSLAKSNERLVCITAAMPTGTRLDCFKQTFPQRFFDVGIAEQHAVTFSAGLAKGGFIPIFAVYSTFLQRGFDQIYHDAALQNLHTVFAIDRAGAVGSDGETHQGIYDLSYLSLIPNMTLMAPCCGEDLKKMITFAVEEMNSPVAVRYPKGEADKTVYSAEKIRLGKGVCIKKGNDALIVSLGAVIREALDAADILEKKGVSVAVMDARFLKPFDKELFSALASSCRIVAAVEDNVCVGGLAANIRSFYCGEVLSFAYADEPLLQASVSAQKQKAGISGENIAAKISERLND